MGALAVREEDRISMLNSGILPHLMTSIPGENMWEVWCGSEFTVACSEDGTLWSTGWNEHGNLGIGKRGASIEPHCYDWLPVRGSSVSSLSEINDRDISALTESAVDHYSQLGLQPLKLSTAWCGALSCGGGHCIAITA